MKFKKPELLAPAGDLEKLKTAVLYGADAVYLAGEYFSLRAKAKNFTTQEMLDGIAFAKAYGKKAYITINIFANEEDFEILPEYLLSIKDAGADAVIVSDPGVFAIVSKILPDMEIHISTQANNTNSNTALFWHKLGASRIVAARELSLTQLKSIRSSMPEDMEIEAFVHGAMCMAYSGRCLLSAFLSDRNANKGNCSQPCRWEYALIEKTRGEEYTIYEDQKGSYIFNSKDLCMIEHIPALVEAGIGSLKIEGRMKTSYYVAAIVSAYRRAIDDYFADPLLYEKNKQKYLEEVLKVSHRPYYTGFYFGETDSQYYDDASYIRDWDYIAVVLDYDQELGIATISQRNKFSVGDTAEVLTTKGKTYSFVVKEMFDIQGQSVDSAPHPKQVLRLKTNIPLEPFDMLRMSK